MKRQCDFPPSYARDRLEARLANADRMSMAQALRQSDFEMANGNIPCHNRGGQFKK
jgi:hypothetical protein